MASSFQLDTRRLAEAAIWAATGPVGLFVGSQLAAGCSAGDVWPGALLSILVSSIVCAMIAVSRAGSLGRLRAARALPFVLFVPMLLAFSLSRCFLGGVIAGGVPYLQLASGLFAAAVLRGDHLPEAVPHTE